MSRAEYNERKIELSIVFARSKANGIIPINTPWAVWCHAMGIYPLT